MSKRSAKKVRHYLPAPSIKERVIAGMENKIKELWEKYGWKKSSAPWCGSYSPGQKTKEEHAHAEEVVMKGGHDFSTEEHVHGEHCKHNH